VSDIWNWAERETESTLGHFSMHMCRFKKEKNIFHGIIMESGQIDIEKEILKRQKKYSFFTFDIFLFQI